MRPEVSAAILSIAVLLTPFHVACQGHPEPDPRARLTHPTDDGIRSLLRVIKDARQIYRRMALAPAASVPEGVRKSSDCVVVIPLGFSLSSLMEKRVAKGVLSCKNPSDHWSPPAFVKATLTQRDGLMGAGDVVVFMRGNEALAALESPAFEIGKEVGAQAGPQGRTATGMAVTDWNGIYWYSRSRANYNGALIEDDPAANAEYYGEAMSRDDILSGESELELPEEARELSDSLG